MAYALLCSASSHNRDLDEVEVFVEVFVEVRFCYSLPFFLLCANKHEYNKHNCAS